VKRHAEHKGDEARRSQQRARDHASSEQIIFGCANLDELRHVFLPFTRGAWSKRHMAESTHSGPSGCAKRRRYDGCEPLNAAATTPDASTLATTAKTHSVYTARRD
jgi:hypothetical protein